MITINGVKISGSGSDVTINNNKIIIDGKDVTPDAKEINISIIGNVQTLEIENTCKIDISGDVKEISSYNGNVNIGGNVSGNCQSHNGNIRCKNIQGSAKTKNGNIYH